MLSREVGVEKEPTAQESMPFTKQMMVHGRRGILEAAGEVTLERGRGGEGGREREGKEREGVGEEKRGKEGRGRKGRGRKGRGEGWERREGERREREGKGGKGREGRGRKGKGGMYRGTKPPLLKKSF